MKPLQGGRTMVAQYDLFSDAEASERAAVSKARTTMADAMLVLGHHWPSTVALLSGVDAWVTGRDGRNLDRGEIKNGYSGEWAYSARQRGFLFEHGDTWGGWYAKPRHMVTWAELQDVLAGYPRQRDGLKRRAEWMIDSGLTDSWRDLTRPFELHPSPEKWHPSYITSDHERNGWPDRLEAWSYAIAWCDQMRADLMLEA